MRAILKVALALGMAALPCAAQKTIASMQVHGTSVSLLQEGPRYCAQFRQAAGGEPMQVENVSMEFTQQVGRITEKTASFSLVEEPAGIYCSEVDLGTHYYRPSRYYIRIRYTDSSGKRQTAQFFLTMK